MINKEIEENTSENSDRSDGSDGSDESDESGESDESDIDRHCSEDLHEKYVVRTSDISSENDSDYSKKKTDISLKKKKSLKKKEKYTKSRLSLNRKHLKSRFSLKNGKQSAHKVSDVVVSTKSKNRTKECVEDNPKNHNTLYKNKKMCVCVHINTRK